MHNKPSPWHVAYLAAFASEVLLVVVSVVGAVAEKAAVVGWSIVGLLPLVFAYNVACLVLARRDVRQLGPDDAPLPGVGEFRWFHRLLFGAQVSDSWRVVRG